MNTNGIDTQSRISFSPVTNRVQVKDGGANRVQANRSVTNRVQFQAVSNRVEANGPVANRLDIAA